MTSLAANLILAVNLGCEMMDVIRQRLQVQKIQKGKAKTVVNGLVAEMFSRKTIFALKKLEPLHSPSRMFQLFHRVAHCSIMQLNETSMQKLFDLMQVGVKYRILLSRSMKCFISSTIEKIRELVSHVSEENAQLIEEAITTLRKEYKHMTSSHKRALKQTLLDYFVGNHTRISVLFNVGLQNPNGSMVLDLGRCYPDTVAPPGSVRHYDCTGTIECEYRVNLAIRKEGIVEFDPKIEDNISFLEKNRYPVVDNGNDEDDSKEEKNPEGKEEHEASAAESKKACEELDNLANLIIDREKYSNQDHFKLDLFGGNSEAFVLQNSPTETRSYGNNPAESKEETYHVDLKSRLGELGFDDTDFTSESDAKEQDPDDFDILEMMDEACSKK